MPVEGLLGDLLSTTEGAMGDVVGGAAKVVTKAANSVGATLNSLGSAVAEGNAQGIVEAGGELLVDGAEVGAG